MLALPFLERLLPLVPSLCTQDVCGVNAFWMLCQCGLSCRSDEEPCSSGGTDSDGEPGQEGASGRPSGNAAPSPGTARGRVGSGAGSSPGRPAHPAAAKDSAGLGRGGAAARRGSGGRGRARAPGASSGRGRGAGEASRPKAGPGGLAAKGASGVVPHKRPSGTFSRLAEPNGASAAGLAHRAVGKKHKGAVGFAQRRLGDGESEALCRATNPKQHLM